MAKQWVAAGALSQLTSPPDPLAPDWTASLTPPGRDARSRTSQQTDPIAIHRFPESLSLEASPSRPIGMNLSAWVRATPLNRRTHCEHSRRTCGMELAKQMTPLFYGSCRGYSIYPLRIRRNPEFEARPSRGFAATSCIRSTGADMSRFTRKFSEFSRPPRPVSREEAAQIGWVSEGGATDPAGQLRESP